MNVLFLRSQPLNCLNHTLKEKLSWGTRRYLSEKGLLHFGVPQGSFLRPVIPIIDNIFFLTYIEDLQKELNEAGSYLNVDDSWYGMVWYGMVCQEDLHFILLKEWMSGLKPSHRVLRSLVYLLPSRRCSEHLDLSPSWTLSPNIWRNMAVFSWTWLNLVRGGKWSMLISFIWCHRHIFPILE